MRLLLILLACSGSSYAMFYPNNLFPVYLCTALNERASDTTQQQQPLPSKHYCSVCFSLICEDPKTTLKKKFSDKELNNHTCNNLTLQERAKILNKEQLIQYLLQQANHSQKETESVELQELLS